MRSLSGRVGSVPVPKCIARASLLCVGNSEMTNTALPLIDRRKWGLRELKSFRVQITYLHVNTTFEK